MPEPSKKRTPAQGWWDGNLKSASQPMDKKAILAVSDKLDFSILRIKIGIGAAHCNPERDHPSILPAPPHPTQT